MYKDKKRAMISGVFAGISDKLGITPAALRILFILIFCLSSPLHYGIGFVPFLIIYVVLAFSLPQKGE